MTALPWTSSCRWLAAFALLTLASAESGYLLTPYPDLKIESVVFCSGNDAMVASANGTSGQAHLLVFTYDSATWVFQQELLLTSGFLPHQVRCGATQATGPLYVAVSGVHNTTMQNELDVYYTDDVQSSLQLITNFTDDATYGDLLLHTFDLPADGSYLLVGRVLAAQDRLVSYVYQAPDWVASHVLPLANIGTQSPLLAISADGLHGIFLSAGDVMAHTWAGNQWTVDQTLLTPTTTVSARITHNASFVAIATPEAGCDIFELVGAAYQLRYTAAAANVTGVISISDNAQFVVTTTETEWLVWNREDPVWTVVQTVSLHGPGASGTSGNVPFVATLCDEAEDQCVDPTAVLYDLSLCYGFGSCSMGRGTCVQETVPVPRSRCDCSRGSQGGHYAGRFCETCFAGFDNVRHCLQCIQFRFGDNCTEEAACDPDYGTCSENLCWGINGTGTCSACDENHFGALCDGEVLCIKENGECEENVCWGINGTGLCSSCGGNMQAMPRCSLKSWMVSVFIFSGLGVLTIAFGAYHVKRFQARNSMAILH